MNGRLRMATVFLFLIELINNLCSTGIKILVMLLNLSIALPLVVVLLMSIVVI